MICYETYQMSCVAVSVLMRVLGSSGSRRTCGSRDQHTKGSTKIAFGNHKPGDALTTKAIG
jgi:hypothetical protein